MAATLPNLFQPLALGPIEVKNRIFSTGHMTLMLDGAGASDDMVAYHEARARGGAGLIITEASAVHPATGPWHILSFSDECIPGYRRIVEAVHPHGTKVFGQMGHSGGHNYTTLDGSRPVAYGPSALPREWSHNMPRAMNHAEIADVIEHYAAAAARMKKAGLDGVELLASHGLLPAQFLNPRMNRRDDEYGGSLENRMRFLREIIAAVRSRIDRDFVFGMRICGDEKQHNAMESDEVLEVCQAIDADGMLDYFNVAAGTMEGMTGIIHVAPQMAFEAGYTAPLAAAIKAKVSKPVLVAGRINQPQVAEQVIANGQADMCGMTRAMICDPEMANKAAAGRLDDIRACVGCNQACIGHMMLGYPVSCIQHPETGRELTYGAREPAAHRRKVLVAGGGPAGMKAAAVAAERGHDVTLCESANALGGQILLAQLLPGRAEFGGIVTNLEQEMKLAGVEVRKGTQVTRALIDAEAPDAVIVATGARPAVPEIEGADEAHVVEAWRVLQDEANVGHSVVIADWRCDWIGLGLAEKLARAGCRVRLAVNGNMAGQTITDFIRDHWVGVLHDLGVETVTYARPYGADADSAYFQHTTSGKPIVFDEVDTLVTALGHEPATELEKALEGWGGEVHYAGDCLNPRTVEEAVLEGLKVGFAV